MNWLWSFFTWKLDTHTQTEIVSEGERERDKEEGADKLGGKEDSVGLPDDTSTRPSSAGRFMGQGRGGHLDRLPATRNRSVAWRMEWGGKDEMPPRPTTRDWLYIEDIQLDLNITASRLFV